MGEIAEHSRWFRLDDIELQLTRSFFIDVNHVFLFDVDSSNVSTCTSVENKSTLCLCIKPSIFVKDSKYEDVYQQLFVELNTQVTYKTEYWNLQKHDKAEHRRKIQVRVHWPTIQHEENIQETETYVM